MSWLVAGLEAPLETLRLVSAPSSGPGWAIGDALRWMERLRSYAHTTELELVVNKSKCLMATTQDGLGSWNLTAKLSGSIAVQLHVLGYLPPEGLSAVVTNDAEVGNEARRMFPRALVSKA
ncbi:MAG: hypothetical protein HN348_18430 [Proteobacteria bacterium]|nr:hypothetical protein [Pseudomonadota bacterium]